jgi:hypothetical protein
LPRVADELKPAYLLTGSDRPKIERALRRLRERVGEDATERFSARDATAEDAVAACNAMGLFATGGRLVLVGTGPGGRARVPRSNSSPPVRAPPARRNSPSTPAPAPPSCALPNVWRPRRTT